jgi:RNA polymerase sigma factor (sigma-70 family)
LEPDVVVQVLLRERLRIAAAAACIVRDVHAADDIFQQVVLTALEHRNEFREPEHLLAWALRACRHRAIDLARRKQMAYLPGDVLDLLEDDWIDTTGTEGSEVAEALHKCLRQLGSSARDLLQLKYADGLSAGAIATRLRRSTDAVYQHLSRVHRVLRTCVERRLTFAGSLPRSEMDT